MRVVPTGAGDQRDLPHPQEFQAITKVRYFADGRRIAFSAIDLANKSHLYVQSVLPRDSESDASADPEQVAEDELVLTAGPSPDGKWLAARAKDKRSVLVNVESGDQTALKDFALSDLPLQWTADGKALWVQRWPKKGSGIGGVELLKYELATAHLTHIGWFDPPDPVGMQGVREGVLTPDGKHYVYTVNQQLDELFLLEGVR